MYKVEIDFDEASKVWRQNKIQVGKSEFKYCCGVLKKNGKPCQTTCKSDWHPCKLHNNIYNLQDIIAHKYIEKKILYLIRWQDYSITESSWEPESNILGENAIKLLNRYKQLQGLI